MPTAAVHFQRVGWSNRKIRGTVLLDTGSSDSFVSRRIAKCLSAPLISMTKKTIYGIAGQTESIQGIELIVSPVKDSSVKLRIQARILESLGLISGSNPQMPWDWDAEASEDFPTVERSIDMLIGQDLLWLTWTRSENQFAGQLVAMQTRLGLVVSGYSFREIDLEKLPPKFSAELKERECRVMIALQDNDVVNDQIQALMKKEKPEKDEDEQKAQQKKGGSEDSFEELMRKFMNFECLGVQPEEKGNLVMKQKDIDALKMFEKHLSFQNGSYSVGLTFNPDAPELVDNYNSAYKRFL